MTPREWQWPTIFTMVRVKNAASNSLRGKTHRQISLGFEPRTDHSGAASYEPLLLPGEEKRVDVESSFKIRIYLIKKYPKTYPKTQKFKSMLEKIMQNGYHSREEHNRDDIQFVPYAP
jgi:hypothetical protein